jgi:hypothetical protein
MPRPQFRLRCLFMLTAIVAVGCLVGPPIIETVRANPDAYEYSAVTLGTPFAYVALFWLVFVRDWRKRDN